MFCIIKHVMLKNRLYSGISNDFAGGLLPLCQYHELEKQYMFFLSMQG